MIPSYPPRDDGEQSPQWVGSGPSPEGGERILGFARADIASRNETDLGSNIRCSRDFLGWLQHAERCP